MNEGENPAFPIYIDSRRMGYLGMTLRDYFAAKAMQGLVGNDGSLCRICQIAGEKGVEAPAMISLEAYALADAMLAERAK